MYIVHVSYKVDITQANIFFKEIVIEIFLAIKYDTGQLEQFLVH